MFRIFESVDKHGHQANLKGPIARGFDEREFVELFSFFGNAKFPPEAFEELAIAWLRTQGYLVLRWDHIALDVQLGDKEMIEGIEGARAKKEE